MKLKAIAIALMVLAAALVWTGTEKIIGQQYRPGGHVYFWIDDNGDGKPDRGRLCFIDKKGVHVVREDIPAEKL